MNGLESRKVKGLVSVERLSASPWPKSRLTGFAALGKAYERKVAKAIPKSLHNPWFRYVDSTGPHCCSPDILVPTSRGIAILEVKLTYNPEAVEQIKSLYQPVVQAFFSLPTFGVIVVKNLGRNYFGPRPKATLEECLSSKAEGFPVLLAFGPTPAHLRAQFTLAP